MTDTEGTEARRSDGEETQFIQPIRDYGRAETKPLDLPRATIGGYRADAVERRVAELERRRTLDQAEISGSNARTTRGRPRTGSSTSV